MNSKLPQLRERKLRDAIGETLVIEKVVSGNSTFGPYVLLITKDTSFISSGSVIMTQAVALSLPATVTVSEVKSTKNVGCKYLSLA